MVKYITELDIYVDKTSNVDKVKHKLDEFDNNVYVGKHTSTFDDIEYICMSVFIQNDKLSALYEWFENEQDINVIIIGS